MREFFDLYKGLFHKALDRSKPLNERVVAVFCMVLPILIFVLLAVFVWQALPPLIGVVTLIYLFFDEPIRAALERKQANEAAQSQRNMEIWDAAWRELGVRVVGPVFSKIFGGHFDPDDLPYWGPLTFGSGFYFTTPAPLTDDNERRNARVQIARRMAGFTGIPPATLLREGLVRVGSDCLYIAASDAVVEAVLATLRAS